MSRPTPSLPTVPSSEQCRLRSECGTAGATWFIVAGWALTVLVAVLFVFRAHNRAAIAEAQVALAETNDKAMEQALAIERLLSERLAQETVDLAEVRISLLSPASAQNSPAYAVVWSPSSGEGVLMRIAPVDLPTSPQFRLIASRQPTSDRIDQDTIFAKLAPPTLERGLFRYQPARPGDVSAFTLEITSAPSEQLILRFGGALRP